LSLHYKYNKVSGKKQQLFLFPKQFLPGENAVLSVYRVNGDGEAVSTNYFTGVNMNNLNSILIEGNLVRDPSFRTTPKGTPVCTFSLASNRFSKQNGAFEKEVSFFDVESWSTLAKTCGQEGRKGRGVRIVGRLKQDRWTDAEGKPHSRVTIVAEHCEFRPERRDSMPAQTPEAVLAAHKSMGDMPF
jgi:single-strand DNA-binding protein